MQWFKGQFVQSNIVSGVLAVAIWGVICYLAVAQIQIPDLLTAGGMSILAFFFGAKMGQRDGLQQAVRKIEEFSKGG